jgi:hypothetical protein
MSVGVADIAVKHQDVRQRIGESRGKIDRNNWGQRVSSQIEIQTAKVRLPIGIDYNTTRWYWQSEASSNLCRNYFVRDAELSLRQIAFSDGCKMDVD